ncbi:transposase [Thalassotalea ponticola]|uniref:transposase n=1 Tax=Thalassotalea ponticola TaxID=1523392 RepID=UPI0025B3C45F|nr:transposase [Thalassotalea ponticola]MDN3653286.1 transposase [Thalassotalea ponticola]
MPRKPRHYLANIPYYIVLKGAQHRLVFNQQQDCQKFCQLLANMSDKYNVKVHAYHLLQAQIHLLLSAQSHTDMPSAMQFLNSSYSKYYNRRYQQKGRLFESRHKASMVDPDSYLLSVMAYIETQIQPQINNQISLSSLRYNSGVAEIVGLDRSANDDTPNSDDFIQPHERYLKLGSDKEQRQQSYHRLFNEQLDKSTTDFICANIAINFPIASPYFIRNLSFEAQLLFAHAKRGRPRKDRPSVFHIAMAKNRQFS